MTQSTLTIEQIRAIANGKLKKIRAPKKTKADYLKRFEATPAAPTLTDAEKAKQRGLFERHDEVVVAIRLPLSPTVNHYWNEWSPKNSVRVIKPLSNEGRAYRESVARFWRNRFKGWPPEPLTGRLRLLVSVSYFNATAIDLDNRIKPLQDALTECKAWLDDSQIDDLRVIRGPLVEKPGCMDVIIETIGE